MLENALSEHAADAAAQKHSKQTATAAAEHRTSETAAPANKSLSNNIIILICALD